MPYDKNNPWDRSDDQSLLWIYDTETDTSTLVAEMRSFSPMFLGYYMNSHYYHKQLFPLMQGVSYLSFRILLSDLCK